MPSQLNQLIYRETKCAFAEASLVITLGYQGFVQADSADLRKETVKVGAKARVLKNTVATKVLAEMGVSGGAKIFAGPTVAVFGKDPVALAKVAVKFAKTRKDKGQIVGGVLDGKIISAAEVAALSKLPSREALIGQVVSLVASPLRGMVTVLAANLRGLVTALDQVREKKEKGAV